MPDEKTTKVLEERTSDNFGYRRGLERYELWYIGGNTLMHWTVPIPDSSGNSLLPVSR